MLKVVVTGSRGFVGSALVKKLKERHIETIEIDLNLGYDILDFESLSDIGSFDILVHLAAKSFVPQSFKEPLTFYKANILGTLNVLELCKKHSAKIIYTSSYVYGTPEYLPIDESHPLKAFNPYAQSKLIGEDLCKAYNRDFGLSAIIFRPFNIYGKGQKGNFLIPSIIKQAISGKVLLKDPRPKRDFINIDDIVEAYFLAINKNFDKVEAFNLGSGVSTSIKTLTNIIAEKMGKVISVSFTKEQRENEVLETLADISKAKTLLNWTPKVSVEVGISAILK